jgi:hypothetical protein
LSLHQFGQNIFLANFYPRFQNGILKLEKKILENSTKLFGLMAG